jgi:hypothetical protein
MTTPPVIPPSLLKLRAVAFEAADVNPFEHDKLGRAVFVNGVSTLLQRVDGPLVMALDSPWGTGKTATVKMLQRVLEKEGIPCVHFNAWQVDHVTDPLVPMVAAIDDLVGTLIGSSGHNSVKKLKDVTTIIVKRVGVTAVKLATMGALELDKEAEGIASAFAGDAADDLFDIYKNETKALAAFNAAAAKVVEVLFEEQAKVKSTTGKPKFVFFVDELDRCRPSFAIEVLERIKHLFDVPGLVFVLSVDRSQLEVSVGKVYGERIEAREYLRRFIDLELRLPPASNKAFVSALLESFHVKAALAPRASYPELKSDGDYIERVLVCLADGLQLRLRTIERVMTRIVVAVHLARENDYLDPHLLVTLIVLRLLDVSLYERYVRKEATAQDVMGYFRNHHPGFEWPAPRVALLIEAYLLKAHEGHAATEYILNDLRAKAVQPSTTPEIKRAHDLLEALQYVPGGNSSLRPINLAAISNLVEFGAPRDR